MDHDIIKLEPCHCGGEIINLLKDYDETVFVCHKCGYEVMATELWNLYMRLKHPFISCPIIRH